MSRPKGSKNRKTLEKFLDSKPIKNNIDVKPKRHRRTKLEMLEAKKQMEELEAKLRENVDSATEKVETAKESINSMKTMEQICEEQLEKAKRENYPQPDFDYRNDYFKGQSVYYIKVNELCGKKEIIELKISSVYPRLIIGYEDRGMSHCIGFDESDMIFFTLSECEQVFKNLIVENKLEDYMQRQKQLANKKRLESLKKGEKNE